jgi:hypothetical protein
MKSKRSIRPRLKYALAFAFALLTLSQTEAASANLIVSPFSPSTQVRFLTVLDPNLFIIRPVVMVHNKKNGMCWLGVFNSDDNGIPTDAPAFRSQLGADKIIIDSDPTWRVFTCAGFSFFGKAMNTGGHVIHIESGAGNDTVFDFYEPTYIDLGEGHDTVVINNQTFWTKSQVYGGSGNDVFFLYSDYVQAFGGGGDDFFCTGGANPGASVMGDEGIDTSSGPAFAYPDVERVGGYPCPAMPQR